MNIIIINLSFIFLFVSFTGCEKLDVPKGTPKCIKKKIKEDSGCLQSVYEYDYRGQKVYYFNIANCPDTGPVLRDEQCNIRCAPAGGVGFTGKDTSFCNNFYKEQTNEKIIWEKDR